jgi:hypothetical protein
MESNEGFVFLDFLKKTLAGWKRLVILMILGGLIGMGISKFQQPLYETRAVVAVTIDYTRTGALSDIQEDQAMRGLGSVIESDMVLDQVVEDAAHAGYLIDRAWMAEHFTLEREDFRWFLRVRDTDANRAASLANIWIGDAMGVLDNAMQHTLIAAHLQQYLDSLEYCLARQSGQSMVVEPCGEVDFEYLFSEIYKTAAEIKNQQTSSLGLMPTIQYFIAEEAPVNNQPVLKTQGVMILCGAMLGFLLAILIPSKENA